MIPDFVKKIVIGLLLLVASFYAGYLYGVQAQKLTQEKSKTQQANVVLEKQVAGQGVANKHEASAVEGVTLIKDHYITVQKDVIKYVTKNPSSNDVLDSEWVRNFNASANGYVAGNSTTDSTYSSNLAKDASQPTATKGEALSAIVDHDKNYYICKKGFDELYSFYDDLRTKLNASEPK